MRRFAIIGIIISCFLLLFTPCINAIKDCKLKDEISTNIDFKINKILLNIFDNKNTKIINSFLSCMLSIYFIGYVLFLPLMYRIAIGSNPYGETSVLEAIISSIFASFLWPFILIELIN